MEFHSQAKNEEKIGDTANTVPILDCNSLRCVPTVEKSTTDKLPPAMLTLIDILARQAAREICGTKEGE